MQTTLQSNNRFAVVSQERFLCAMGAAILSKTKTERIDCVRLSQELSLLAFLAISDLPFSRQASPIPQKTAFA